MNVRKIIVLASIGLALFMVVPTTGARADGCYYCNPLLFPLAVAGAVVGTAAAIVTAPFCPTCGPYYYGYYGPAPVYAPPYPPAYAPAYASSDYRVHHRVWVRGHYNRNGAWVPGHWRHGDKS